MFDLPRQLKTSIHMLILFQTILYRPSNQSQGHLGENYLRSHLMSIRAVEMGTEEGILYHGNCHCGSYRFDLHLQDPIGTIKCDCLLCKKQGYLWQSLDGTPIAVTRDDGHLVQYSSPDLTYEVNACPKSKSC